MREARAASGHAAAAPPRSVMKSQDVARTSAIDQAVMDAET